MSTDFLRFPSGATVAQIKKDAKRMAKERAIPLHAALDTLASENGILMSWHKALAYLQHTSTPLFRLNLAINTELPNRPPRHVIDIFPHIGPILVLGGMGTGKSVLATHLASEALDSGATAVCITSAPSGGRDLASRRLLALKEHHGTRVQMEAQPPTLDTHMPAGGLLIVDEYTRNAALSLESLRRLAAEKCFAVAVISQDAPGLLSDTALRHTAESCGALFIGATPDHLAQRWINSTDSRDIRAAISIATTLQSPSSAGCDFVALTASPRWLDVIRCA